MIPISRWQGRGVDILLSLKEEDSYGLSLVFARWLRRVPPTAPYFRRGQRRGLTFGLPAHRSFGREQIIVERNKKQALYPRPERRGFTAQVGNFQMTVVCKRYRTKLV